MSTDPVTRNWPTLIQVAQQIRKDPASWFQGAWRYVTDCGTAYCFAGHTIVLTGHEFLRERTGFIDSYRVVANGLLADSAAASDGTIRTDEAAAALLGLNWFDAAALFAGDNTFPELLHLLNSWALEDEAVLPPDLTLTAQQCTFCETATDKELADWQAELLEHGDSAVPSSR